MDNTRKNARDLLKRAKSKALEEKLSGVISYPTTPDSSHDQNSNPNNTRHDEIHKPNESLISKEVDSIINEKHNIESHPTSDIEKKSHEEDLHEVHTSSKINERLNMFQHKNDDHIDNHQEAEKHIEPISNKVKLLNKGNNSPGKMKMFGMPKPDDTHKLKLDVNKDKDHSSPIKLHQLHPTNENKQNEHKDEHKDEIKPLPETGSKTNIAKLMKRITSAKGMIKNQSAQNLEKHESAKIMGLASMLQSRLIKPAMDQVEINNALNDENDKVDKTITKKKMPFFVSSLDSDVQVLDDEKIKEDIQINLNINKIPLNINSSSEKIMSDKKVGEIFLEKPVQKNTKKRSKANFKETDN